MSLAFEGTVTTSFKPAASNGAFRFFCVVLSAFMSKAACVGGGNNYLEVSMTDGSCTDQ